MISNLFFTAIIYLGSNAAECRSGTRRAKAESRTPLKTEAGI